MTRRYDAAILWLAVAVMGTAALLLALLSLRWPLFRDLPLMLYPGFLVSDLGAVPYRDFMDMNPPGTILLGSLLHTVTQGVPLVCRITDLLLLAAIGIATCVALRSRGIKAGLLATFCFAIAYLSRGPGMSLQREFVCMLPLSISAALILGGGDRGQRAWLRWIFRGVLAGLAGSVKPPIVICWIPLVLLACWRTWDAKHTVDGRGLVRSLAPGFGIMAGGVVALLAVGTWLWATGGLGSYLEMVRAYYPLYMQIGGDGAVCEAGLLQAFSRYVVQTLPVPREYPFIAAAMLGLAWGVRHEERHARVLAVTIVGVVLLGLLYVPLSGKF